MVQPLVVQSLSLMESCSCTAEKEDPKMTQLLMVCFSSMFVGDLFFFYMQR
jgi:hypothetical protein